jgi:hypothetical protein
MFIPIITILLCILYFVFSTDKDTHYITNFSDYITSIFFFIIIALFILSQLSDIFPRTEEIFKRVIKIFMWIIPDDKLIGKKLKNYLSSLIKTNKEIIIFMPFTTSSNQESLLLQLVGFLEILDKPIKDDNKNNFSLTIQNKDIFDVNIVFVKENSDDIKSYLKDVLDIRSQNEYILITVMSEIYKNAISAKKLLLEDEQKKIKIIGVLSSISVNIESDINKDSNIIRVYPPDYDEADIAISFMMSRIKNNICHLEQCNYKNKKSNIIILHANEYGEAVTARAKEFYELAMKDILKTTNTNLNTFELEECISFYSFTYKNNNFNYDFIDDPDFHEHIDKWIDESSSNYFFFIGYQPNISEMIKIVSKKVIGRIDDYCYLFSSPMSMDIWRNQAWNTLQENEVTQTSYYLSANTYNKENQLIKMEELLEKYNNNMIQKVGSRNEITNVSFSDLFNKNDVDIYFEKEKTEIEKFKENNFISTFAKLGMYVAKEYIETDNTLLLCKQKVFEKKEINLKLLINGDSINNFTIKILDQNDNEKNSSETMDLGSSEVEAKISLSNSERNLDKI